MVIEGLPYTQKINLCLASHSLYLFFERKELLEIPYNLNEHIC